MYQHLKDLRESLGLTQSEFGKSIGVAKSTYNNYETGIREPKSDFWIAIATKYGVTIDYLMGFSDDPSATSAKHNNAPSLSNEALQIARDYSDLDKPGKRAVRVTLDDQTQRVREEAKKEKSSAEFIFLPWNDQPASAGTGFDLDDEQMVEWKVIHNELTRKADFCLDVQGDSMEPKFSDGDTILVRRQPSVDIGEIGLFIVDGKGYVKKQGPDRLISLNPTCVDIYPNEYSDARCAGKVLGILRPEWIIRRK